MNILCFGDSNTYGFEPGTGARYDEDTRWTGILQNNLGNDYNVIEEGKNGRTISKDDPIEIGRNGIEYLIPCLKKHKKIDLIVIMLGTNDVKRKFSISAKEITLCLSNMIDIIKMHSEYFTGKKVNILISAPAPCKNSGGNEEDNPAGINSFQKSIDIVSMYEDLAKEKGCHFFNSSLHIEVSNIDCVHLDKDSHKILGDEIYKKIKTCI